VKPRTAAHPTAALRAPIQARFPYTQKNQFRTAQPVPKSLPNKKETPIIPATPRNRIHLKAPEKET
jgi:hypothetical protein